MVRVHGGHPTACGTLRPAVVGSQETLLMHASGPEHSGAPPVEPTQRRGEPRQRPVQRGPAPVEVSEDFRSFGRSLAVWVVLNQCFCCSAPAGRGRGFSLQMCAFARARVLLRAMRRARQSVCAPMWRSTPVRKGAETLSGVEWHAHAHARTRTRSRAHTHAHVHARTHIHPLAHPQTCMHARTREANKPRTRL